MIPLSIPLIFIEYKNFTIEEMSWIFILGACSNLAQYSLIKALSKADISTVLPFDFSRLIFVSILSYFTFDEKLDRYTFIGALVIFCSSIYVARKQKKTRQRL